MTTPLEKLLSDIESVAEGFTRCKSCSSTFKGALSNCPFCYSTNIVAAYESMSPKTTLALVAMLKKAYGVLEKYGNIDVFLPNENGSTQTWGHYHTSVGKEARDTIKKLDKMAEELEADDK